MEQEKLKWLFIMTIMIIIILFTIVLLTFNTIEGMSPYNILSHNITNQNNI